MKILYVTYSPAPYRVSLLNEMGRQCELEVLFEKSREEITNRNERWFAAAAEHFRAVYLRDCGLPGLLRRLRQRSYDAAVVGGYSSPAAVLCLFVLRFRKIPVLLCADGMLEKKEAYLRKKLKGFLAGPAAGYLVSGRYTERRLQDIGVRGKPFFLFPLTTVREEETALCRQERAKLRAEYGIREKTMILAAGQFIGRKGYDLLLDCIPFLAADTGIYICGDRPPWAWAELAGQDPRLHFPGFADHKTMLEMMRCCDIFVHPARYEVWGLAVSEAMMTGACVVTTDRCGAGLELVRSGENGMLVKAGDREQLLAVLKRLEKDAGFREALGAQAQRDTRERTIERSARDHLTALEAVCGKR